jgi:hypothetical protein
MNNEVARVIARYLAGTSGGVALATYLGGSDLTPLLALVIERVTAHPDVVISVAGGAAAVTEWLWRRAVKTRGAQ